MLLCIVGEVVYLSWNRDAHVGWSLFKRLCDKNLNQWFGRMIGLQDHLMKKGYCVVLHQHLQRSVKVSKLRQVSKKFTDVTTAAVNKLSDASEAAVYTLTNAGEYSPQKNEQSPSVRRGQPSSSPSVPSVDHIDLY